MKLSPQQLSSHLKKTLHPVYWIAGDETYLVEKAVATIIKTARTQGFLDKQKFYIDTGFKWGLLQQEIQSLSLFSDKKVIECRLNQVKIPDAGKSLLAKCAAQALAEKLIVIQSPKLNTATLKTKWFKAIEKNTVFIPIQPLNNMQLRQWILKQLAKANLTASKEGVNLLIAYGEGNLLAITQNIEKLKLLYGENKALSLNDIARSISNSSHFNVFALSDAVLTGDSKRIVHIVNILQEQGVEGILVLWALAREIRLLANISHYVEKGEPLQQVLRKYAVWEKRKSVVIQAQKQKSAAKWRHLLSIAQSIDEELKTGAKEQAWQSLLALALKI